MIDIEDSDQPLLEMDDLREGDGEVNPNIKLDYCTQKTELRFIALEVSRLSSSGMIGQASPAAVQSVNSRLLAWALSNGSGIDYEALSLHIFYETIVIHWHRISVNTQLVGKNQSRHLQRCI
jgi:hypothetical protein